MQENVLTNSVVDSTLWLDNFVDVYQKLSIDNLDLLGNIYHQNITFEDPMHKVEGFTNLHRYFKRLYENLSSCEFVIEQVIVKDDNAAIYWKMIYQHTKLNKGKNVTVYGNSLLKSQDDKVIYHRDFLDLGAMLYEQLPVFGKLIKWIKSQAVK
jgi:hypothetical protein